MAAAPGFCSPPSYAADPHTELLALIAANRNPESYVSGATVLHIAEDTPRFSDDLDLFHDLEDRCPVTLDKTDSRSDAGQAGTPSYAVRYLPGMRVPSYSASGSRPAMTRGISPSQ